MLHHEFSPASHNLLPFSRYPTTALHDRRFHPAPSSARPHAPLSVVLTCAHLTPQYLLDRIAAARMTYLLLPSSALLCLRGSWDQAPTHSQHRFSDPPLGLETLWVNLALANVDRKPLSAGQGEGECPWRQQLKRCRRRGWGAFGRSSNRNWQVDEEEETRWRGESQGMLEFRSPWARCSVVLGGRH